MNKGDWKDSIFDDATLPYLTIALYENAKPDDENSITPHQVYTVLERKQFLYVFPNAKTFSILDDQGNLSKEALKYLAPQKYQNVLASRLNTLSDLTQDQLKKYRALIAELPVSERVFHVDMKGKARTAYFLTMNKFAISELKEHGYDQKMLMNPNHYDLNLFGALNFIDMIENRDEWLKMNIDPNFMPQPFSYYYKNVKNISSHLMSNDRKLNTLSVKAFKALAYQSLLDAKLGENFAYISQMIDEYVTKNENCLQIVKYGKDSPKRNQIYLSFHGQEFNRLTLSNFLQRYLEQSPDKQLKLVNPREFQDRILRDKYSFQKMRHYMKLKQHNKSHRQISFEMQP